jgi:hypothetical protein|nr:MAG TPA: hypothetical protein [Caudoviricetes sp.]
MDDQTFLNQLAEKLSKLGTVRPLGFHYLHPYGTVPADSIICNGTKYSRALYKDFFDYITAQGWVKTEDEWQEIAGRDKGCCPFYSDGDGSTNFRTPMFASYQQIAMDVDQATTYHQAGVPNIEGTFGTRGIELDTNVFKSTGAFFLDASFPFTDPYGGHGNNKTKGGIGFSARAANNLYGASNTVQPESHEWVMCVVAYGIATNVGSVDIQNVMSAVNAVQAQVGETPKPNAYVTKTWRSGTSWYRVWSDGFIEQGGSYTSSDSSKYTITLNKPMTTTYYHCDVTGGYNTPTDRGWGYAYDKTTSNFKAVVVEPKGMWEVHGY